MFPGMGSHKARLPCRGIWMIKYVEHWERMKNDLCKLACFINRGVPKACGWGAFVTVISELPPSGLALSLFPTGPYPV